MNKHFVTDREVPLVVDLDGTLLRTDLLYESFFASCIAGPSHHARTAAALARGRSAVKAHLAAASQIDYAVLPYNPAVLDLIETARSTGRRVYLATAADRIHADGVAEHLGLFDGVLASEDGLNLSGDNKAKALVTRFGEGAFDYVGNSRSDLPVWSRARKVVSVDLPSSVRDTLGRLGKPTTHIGGTGPTLKTWIKALRVPQYAKNLLVLVPLVTSHAFTASNVLHAILAFMAFSLCASSVYLLNDLVDLDSDRRHPIKRNRPFASGSIPLAYGPPAIALLLGASAVVAWSISWFFLGALACYWALTLSYSLWLKRKLIVDVVVLAGLYTIRVIAGAIALPVVLSEWLLAFSMFIFVALALVKRYVELSLRIEHDLPDATNRNYRLRDLPIVGALAAASAFNSISVFALYVSADQTRELYSRPELLWLICPLLLYWLGRVLVLAHRRIIEDDPVVFALRDRVSAITGVLTFAIMIAAS